MNSAEIVSKLERAFQYGEPFTMPALAGEQLKEILMIMINRVLGTTKSKYVLNYIHGKRMYHKIDLNRSNSNL